MHAIDRKLLRDFRRLWLQAVAIALVLACGVAILLTSAGMYQALNDTRAAYYERNRFADVFASTGRAPLSLLREISAIEGVLAVEPRVTGSAILDLDGRDKNGVGRIISYPETDVPVLNIPLLLTGRFPDPEAVDEVTINGPFALANGFRIGSRFQANLNGQKRTLTVVGTALSPEFIYTIGPGGMMPDNESFGILWMPERVVAAAFDMTGAFNDLSLSLATGMQLAPVLHAVDALLEPYGGIGAFGRDEQQSNAFLDAEISQLKGMAYILPPIFFGISAFLVSMVMGRIVALERSEIGLLKAIGYSKLEVSLHYLMLAGLIALVGIALGWAAGTWLAKAMARQYAAFFDFPFVIFHVSYWIYAAAGFAGVLTTTLGALKSALSAARLPPAVAMQPPAPPRFKRSFADRAMAAMKLSQPTVMILRSVLRWPVRSALSVLGMAFAVGAVISAMFMNDALDEIVDSAFFQNNRQDAMLLFAHDVPVSALEDVRNLPGVLQAEAQQYHTAVLRHGHLSKRTAIEARPPETDLSRVLDADGHPVSLPRGGIVLSQRLASHLGVASGGTVEAEFLSGRRETFDLAVVAVVEQHFGLGAYVDLDFLNALFRQGPQMSVVNVTLDDTEMAPLYAALKAMPLLSGLVQMTDNRRAFQDTIEQNVVVMNVVYLVIAVLITVGVAYNGARIQLSERARELASLRILGFRRSEVSYILVGEMMLLALLAQPVGWGIGAWIATAMTNGFSSDLYSIPLVLKPAIFAKASLVVLSAALVSVLVVRQRLDQLNLVSVMKTRE